MGSRGPIPKRADARAGHRTKAEQPDRVRAGDQVRRPAAPRDWHPRARAWYAALARSGQSEFYEPSDWQQALVLGDMLNTVLSSDRPSSEMFKAFLAGSHDLGVTEGARRRMRIEVERTAPTPIDDVAVSLEAYRRRASGG